MMYDNLHAKSDTQELKLQTLRVPKTLFYDFKVAISFLYIVSFRSPWSHMTRMLYDNLHAKSDTQELKLQRLRVPKTLFYDFKVDINFLNIVSLRWPCHMTCMMYDNLYANSDTQESKLQWISIPKPHFMTLRWPWNS